MELHMLKVSIGMGYQVLRSECSTVVLQYAIECAGYDYALESTMIITSIKNN